MYLRTVMDVRLWKELRGVLQLNLDPFSAVLMLGVHYWLTDYYKVSSLYGCSA